MGGTIGSSGALDRRTRLLLVARLNRDGALLARRFSLTYKSIEAEHANVTSRYGICYSDGVIKIRLRHAVTGRPLKYSSLVNTLCHELAHLRHFDHGERFKLFYQQILGFARAEGIYQPSSGQASPRVAVATSAINREALPQPRASEVSRRLLASWTPAENEDASVRPEPVQLGLFGL